MKHPMFFFQKFFSILNLVLDQFDIKPFRATVIRRPISSMVSTNISRICIRKALGANHISSLSLFNLGGWEPINPSHAPGPSSLAATHTGKILAATQARSFPPLPAAS